MSAAASPLRKGALGVGPESKFFRMDNSYVDILPRKVSGWVEYWAIGYIERMSIGFNRSETGPLSLRDMAALAPGDPSRQTDGCALPSLVEALKHALQAGLIAREAIPKKKEFSYRTLRENWRKAPDYKPVEKKKAGEQKARDRTGGPVQCTKIAPRKTAPVVLPNGQTVRLHNLNADVPFEYLQGSPEDDFDLGINPVVQVLEFPKQPPKADDQKPVTVLRSFVEDCFKQLGAPLPAKTMQRIERAVNGDVELYQQLVRKDFDQARAQNRTLGAGILLYIAEKNLPAARVNEKAGNTAKPSLPPPKSLEAHQEIERIARDIEALENCTLPDLRIQYEERIRFYEPEKVEVARTLIEMERNSREMERLADALRCVNDPAASEKEKSDARKIISAAPSEQLTTARAIAHAS